MPKLRFSDIANLCEQLLDQGRDGQVIELLERANLGYEDREEWAITRQLLNRISPEFRSAKAAYLYAKALRILRDYDALTDWRNYIDSTQNVISSALVQLEVSAGLNRRQQYSEAKALLESILPYLSGEALGIAWARLGFALFNLNQPWEIAFQKAQPLLKGEELGRALLNYGYCLAVSERRAEAHQIYQEALALFTHNPYFSAWIRYNLGTLALSDLDLEAERHFLKALELTRNPKAEGLRAAIYIGLGRFRRSLGEWHRAEFSYRKALESAVENYDKLEAYRGLTRTFQLSGLLSDALEILELALQDSKIEHQGLYLAQALIYLKQGQAKQAKTSLTKAGTAVGESDNLLFRIAGAELARLEDRLDEAVQLLEGLPLHTLYAREEVRQWPKLFALLEASGREIPRPLEYVQGTTVRVQALGVLQVSVNGRLVELIPTGRVGELLVFLLEQGGAASLEAIGDALYPDLTQAPKRRKAVWKLVNGLRQALGWEDSVLALRGAYQLDPQATWLYDVAEARVKREARAEFLAGVYSEWAIEVGRELQDLAPRDRQRDLN